MSKEFNNIDELFQSAFENDVAEVPAYVKINIDKKIGFSKKKTIGFWFGGMLTLLAIIAVTFMVNSNKVQKNDLADVINEQNKSDHSESTQVINQTITSTTGTSENTQNSNGINLNGSDQNNSATALSNQTNNSTTGIDYSEKSGNQTNSLTATDIKKNQTTPDNISADKKNLPETKNDVQVNKSGNWSDEKNSSSQLSQTNYVKNPGRVEEIQLLRLPLMNCNKSIRLTYPDQSGLGEIRNNPAAIPIQGREIYNPWMFSATGGMNLSSSKYTSTIPSEEDLYKNSTSAKPGFDLNLNMKYRLKNSLTFGSGVGLSQLTENYHFFKQDYQLDSNLTWTYTYDSLDTTQMFPPIDSSYVINSYDSSLVTLYDEQGVTRANYLQIPLTVGTQIIRNKFRFDFYVSGRFNYLLNANGGYLKNDAFTLISKNQNDLFKKMYFDVMIGGEIHYQILDKFYLTATVRYKPTIGQIYQGADFNRVFQSCYLGMGVSYKL